MADYGSVEKLQNSFEIVKCGGIIVDWEIKQSHQIISKRRALLMSISDGVKNLIVNVSNNILKNSAYENFILLKLIDSSLCFTLFTHRYMKGYWNGTKWMLSGNARPEELKALMCKSKTVNRSSEIVKEIKEMKELNEISLMEFD